MNISLADKQILITGGTSALGRAFVAKAVEEGATVYFTFHQDVNEAERLEGLGAKQFQVDLRDSARIDTLKKEIRSHTTTLDAIIHNAAIVRDRTIQNMTDEEWSDVLSVDLKGVYYLTKKFLSFLFKNPGSKILNVVSRVGFHGGFGEANYAAAKAGVISLTKSLASELGKKKILVNGLNPGFMKSKMTSELPEETIQKNVDASVLKEISDPDAVSDFMIYLLSDQFRGVSGQIFHFDSRGVSAW